MKTRKIMLLIVALATLSLLATACNKTDASANANAFSSPGKNSVAGSGATSTASGTSAPASKRFVGTWTEEGVKNDKGSKFTEDGKVIEVSTDSKWRAAAAMSLP